jgi:hypothetical protein
VKRRPPPPAANRVLYGVVHSGCGHLAGAHNERNAALAVARHLGPGWHVAADVSDEALAALLAGDRCDVCAIPTRR